MISLFFIRMDQRIQFCCCSCRKPECCCYRGSGSSSGSEPTGTQCSDCLTCLMSPNMTFCSHNSEDGVQVESYSLIPGCAKNITSYNEHGRVEETESCCGLCRSSNTAGNDGIQGESTICCCSYSYDASNFSTCPCPCCGDTNCSCGECKMPSCNGAGNCCSEQLGCDCCKCECSWLSDICSSIFNCGGCPGSECCSNCGDCGDCGDCDCGDCD